MTARIERFEGHPVHGSLSQLAELGPEVRTSAESLGADAVEATSRIEQVVKLIASSISSVDPGLVPFSTLDSVNGNIARAIQEVTAFTSNRNTAHLTNANTHLDTALLSSRQLVFLQDPTTEGYREVITSVRASAGQYMRHLREEHDDLIVKLEDANEDLRILGERIRKQTQQSEAITTELRQRFDASDQERKDAFEKQQTARALEVDEFVKSSRESFDEVIGSSKKDVTDLLSSMKGKLREAKDIVGLLADTALAGEHHKYANDDQERGELWRRISLFFLLGLVGAALLLFYGTANAEATVWSFSARILIVVSLGVGAAFAGQQSHQHLSESRRHRRIALALTAMSPYLEDLDDTKRQEIKSKLADQLFGHFSESDREQAIPVSSVWDVLKTVTNNLSRQR